MQLIESRISQVQQISSFQSNKKYIYNLTSCKSILREREEKRKEKEREREKKKKRERELKVQTEKVKVVA